MKRMVLSLFVSFQFVTTLFSQTVEQFEFAVKSSTTFDCDSKDVVADNNPNTVITFKDNHLICKSNIQSKTIFDNEISKVTTSIDEDGITVMLLYDKDGGKTVVTKDKEGKYKMQQILSYKSGELFCIIISES